MERITMVTLSDKEFNKLNKIVLTVKTMINRGLIDEEQFNEIMDEED
nr:MAG TPA: Short C-terminal domain [Caudoviricetes sp.]